MRKFSCGGGRKGGGDLLVRRHGPALLEVRAGAEGAVEGAGKD